MNRGRVETPRGKFKHSDHLFVREMKPLGDLVNRGSRFQIFEHERHRHSGVPEEPRPADFAGDAFDRGAF